MTLSDLRKVCVKKRLRIRFPLSNGMECILNEHGIAQVPALRAVPAFSLEDELGSVKEFVVETVAVSEKDKHKIAPRSYTRDEMMTFTSGDAGESASPEHDE